MDTPPLPDPLRGLLLDMDGTLVDTEPLHFRSAVEVVAAHGVRLRTEDILPYVGWAETPFWEDLKRRFGLAPPAGQLLAERTATFLDLLHTHSIEPLPGVLDLLDWAAAQGIPAAVGSSSPRAQIEATLTAAGLLGRLRAWRSGHEDVPAGRGKPHPDVYLRAAADLGVPAEACVAVEDSRTGSAAARASGAFVFGVSCPSHPVDHLPAAHRMERDMHGVLAALRAGS